ncbi:2,3-diketo-5-methylthio-1-phosphopentane phosphatase [Tothia fuscella]|uniref:2,3-diketo-5-methylthio-1-phosphopentane phosphatase n=1 Tax=Tothia fuscella TaxID=1048955 RepID=A0A9P4NVW0_9PEZI|nr:2,3-diketo-5-methylthio-1-phosphopentane phosphatase [Tothia fuscella]
MFWWVTFLFFPSWAPEYSHVWSLSSSFRVFVRKALRIRDQFEPYPYALQILPTVLKEQWTSEPFQPYKTAFSSEVQQSPEVLLSHVQQLSASDVKDPALKKLQGFLWSTGYESGAITTPLFPDAASQIKAWKQEDALTLAIFSSGSVEAQKLFFKYIGISSTVVEGVTAEKQKTEDLNPLFSANFDTVNAGPKMVKESYVKIAEAMGKKVEEILFLSDNVSEVRAAQDAGMQSIVVDRTGNAPLSEEDEMEFIVIKSIDELELLNQLDEST